MATTGADYVLVNPLHAAEPVAPIEPSPDLPTSRRSANPIYPIYPRVERIPEYATVPAEVRTDVEELGGQLAEQVAKFRRPSPSRSR